MTQKLVVQQTELNKHHSKSSLHVRCLLSFALSSFGVIRCHQVDWHFIAHFEQLDSAMKIAASMIDDFRRLS